MQIPWKSVFFLSLLCCGASLMAQRFSIDSSSIKIEREFVKAPVFQAARTYKTLTKPAHEVRWLQFLITYTPKSSGKDVVWQDDLLAEITVLLPAKKGEGYGSTILLTGKQVFYSVPGDGKRHYVLFQIPPAVLTKYCDFPSYDNRELVNKVYAAVTFRRGNNNQLLATGYAEMKTKKPNEVVRIFSNFYNSKIGVVRLENNILPKEKTPWQWIDMDVFDFPKSLMEGKQ